MKLKQTLRKIGEPKKSKFVKSGLDYKDLLRHIKRTRKDHFLEQKLFFLSKIGVDKRQGVEKVREKMT